MTTETARLLAQALLERETARVGLVNLLKRDDIETPAPVERALRSLAATYVHEDRIINRIVSEDVDGEVE